MANGPLKELFGEADLNRINASLDALEQAVELIDMAKQAGIDIAEQEERARQAREQLLRFKHTFFPNR